MTEDEVKLLQELLTKAIVLTRVRQDEAQADTLVAQRWAARREDLQAARQRVASILSDETPR